MIKEKLDFDYIDQWCNDYKNEVNAIHKEEKIKEVYINRLKNRAKSVNYVRQWQIKNSEKVRANSRRYRALKANAEINDFTAEQWLQMLKEHNYTCAYCGRSDIPMTQDHIVPLSRGGNHTRDNITPCCQSCNSQKNDKNLNDFLAYNLKV